MRSPKKAPEPATKPRPILPRDWKLTLPRDGEDWAAKEEFDDLSRRSLSEHLTTVRCRGKLNLGEVAVICVLRNEAERLQLFFEHYKKLGVDRFFMVDNDSTDGSRDLLLAEPLADVFHTAVPYAQSCFGLYWYNGLAQAFCEGNWVLMADADELLVFDGMDRHKLSELGQWLSLRGFDRLFAVMLDVYPSGSIGRGERKISEILEKDCWFDDQGYFVRRAPTGWSVIGGARNRIFEEGQEAVPVPISKYPFFRVDPQTTICNAHFLWPFDTTINVAFAAFIHLKLMDDFMNRSMVNEQEGQHWAGAFHYRRINRQFDSAPEIVALSSFSQLYTGPQSLIEHKIMSPIRWEDPRQSATDSVPYYSRGDLAVGKIGWRPWRDTTPAQGSAWKYREDFVTLSDRSLNEHLTEIRCRGPLREGELGLICVLRNEIARLPLFLDHYKMLGVTRFFIVDNGSEDGSHELLVADPNVDLFHTQVPFSQGQGGLYWANAIMRKYCRGHWIVRVDADELLVYDGMESHDLRQFAGWLQARGMDRIFAPLLDVYPSAALDLSRDRDLSDFLHDCWFDATGYRLHWTRGGWYFSGGARGRLFKGVDYWPLLSKYPFFRVFEETVAFHHHWLWPYDEVTEAPQGALIHLKLMNDLAERAETFVREGQHFRGSEDYKVINDHLREKPNIEAFHDRSCRYRGPKSLVRQRFIAPIAWGQAARPRTTKQSEVPTRIPDRGRWISTFPLEGAVWQKRVEFNWISHSALTDQIMIIRSRGPLVPGEVGAICVLRNEAERLPTFFEHYKKLGVTRFLMIDNKSDDGSHEIIRQEPMADVFLALGSYTEALGGIYWANGIAREFCRGCWTIRADADELFVYDGMQQNDLARLARLLESEQRDRIFALMIDVYPSGKVDQNMRSIREMIEEDCWFDSEGYEEEKHKGGWLITGGPRRRLFSQGPIVHRHWLSKYPFLLIKPETSIVDAHFVWPIEEQKPTPMSALLHLKFMDDFRDRSVRHEQEGQHALGSRAYKIINEHLAQMPDLVVHYAGSKRYEGPQSLIQHGLMQPLSWNK